MHKVRYQIGVFVLLLLVASTRPASADQIQWTGVGMGSWVSFSVVGSPLGSPFSDFVGEITWNWLPSNQGFFSYCVDATQYLTSPQTVDIKSTDSLTGASQSYGPVVAGGGDDAGKRIAWLLNQFSTEAHGDTSGISAAALQIAIWETLYDATPDLNLGTFSLVDNAAYGNTGSIRTKAKSDLDALYSNPAGGYYTSSAVFLDTGYGQDQVTGNPVPEPASLTLLGSGILAVALRRRRSRATEV